MHTIDDKYPTLLDSNPVPLSLLPQNDRMSHQGRSEIKELTNIDRAYFIIIYVLFRPKSEFHSDTWVNTNLIEYRVVIYIYNANDF